MTWFLVRHGRPTIDRAVPAHEWELDPAGYDDVWGLRESGRIPPGVAWYSSPEPKALQTAQLLSDSEVGVIPGFREHRRDASEWLPDFPDVVRRAFAEPSASVSPGWEPLADCRDRVTAAARSVRLEHEGGDVALVGHGTAWTVLVAELTDAPPDLDRWEALRMPDLIVVEPA